VGEPGTDLRGEEKQIDRRCPAQGDWGKKLHPPPQCPRSKVAKADRGKGGKKRIPHLEKGVGHGMSRAGSMRGGGGSRKGKSIPNGQPKKKDQNKSLV